VSAERFAAAVHRYRWEGAWGAFVLANLVWMVTMPAWASVPFHFIWLSLTVLYGFRLWSNALTSAIVGLVVGSTGVVLLGLWAVGMPIEELLELPLMFGMFLAMMLHATRRRAAIAQLRLVSEQNARMLQRERSFIQNASHELRTPITVALAHAELVQLTITEPPVKDDVAMIADELGRLHGLTDRLLLLAAADAPGFVDPVPTDLADLLAATLRRWSPTPRRWQIGCRDDATVLADPERLILALDTILDNAIKVTNDGDLIELCVAREGNSAVIEVRDAGPGIAPELLETLFERFARGETQRGSRPGFGLGLAIVHEIVEAHGGRVTARNRADGGAVVTLRLPLAEPEIDVAPAPALSSLEAPDDVAADPAPHRLVSLP
jgi:signal transduction histidine kinase